MARQRRGAWSPPELRGTLGTLLRTTLAQAGSLRDALERGAREGRTRVSDALAGRRRNDALAELGEIVLDLIRRGEIDVKELPEVQDVVAHLDELDAEVDSPDSPESPDSYAPPPSAPARRFDTRRAADDGTVSSRTWSPGKRPSAPKSSAPARVWRPPVSASSSSDEPDAPTTPAPPPAARRGGGIRFSSDADDDSDLSSYMHPDDVPPKKPNP